MWVSKIRTPQGAVGLLLSQKWPKLLHFIHIVIRLRSTSPCTQSLSGRGDTSSQLNTGHVMLVRRECCREERLNCHLPCVYTGDEWQRQPGLSSPHRFPVRNTIMVDNKIFFRKQGIRTTIIVNKMLVLIKMISLVFFFLLSFVTLICHCCCCALPWWHQDGWLYLTQATKTCFLLNLKIHAHVFLLLLEENVIFKKHY